LQAIVTVDKSNSGLETRHIGLDRGPGIGRIQAFTVTRNFAVLVVSASAGMRHEDGRIHERAHLAIYAPARIAAALPAMDSVIPGSIRGQV
jgi:hypothetical protein